MPVAGDRRIRVSKDCSKKRSFRFDECRRRSTARAHLSPWEGSEMERDTAVRLLAAIESMSPPFNRIDSLTSEISDESERKELRRMVAQAMSLLAFEFVMHIVRQYPDLDPDGDRFRSPRPLNKEA